MNHTQKYNQSCTLPSRVFKKSSNSLAIIAILAFTTGCASQLKRLPKKAQVVVPTAWQQQTNDSSSKNTLQGEVQGGWLNSFNDPVLDTYVQRALLNNPDLLGSAAQLRAAIEQVSISGANLWPNVTAGASKNRTEVTGSTGGVSVINGVGVGGDGSSGSVVAKTARASLDISWEVDIWGRITQAKKSAAYSAKAQGELFKAAELSLVANVSRAWYNLVTNKLLLNLAQQQLESFESTASLIEENYKRGLRSALDVYLSRTDVQLQVSTVSDAHFNYLQAARILETLMGEYPNAETEVQADLPTINDSVPTGLPAALLVRRPDVRASQLQYRSAIAGAKAANRDRYPSLAFSGSIGDSRDELDQLFDSDNLVETLVAGITMPLFRAGALKSREQQAAYQAEASYASLLKTTLSAFQEVENSLALETALKEQHIAIKKAVESAQGGLDLALDRYQSGIENYTTVLESQRRLFGSMRNEINLRNALVQNRVAIHLALGGDYTTIPDRDPFENLPTAQKRQKAK